MKSPLVSLIATGSLALLVGCSSMQSTERGAPQPLKKIDAARFYSGLWHEIGRRPMAITDGCVAGATEYRKGTDGRIDVLDSCRMGTPSGEAKTIGGPGTILDPGTNAKLRVDYKLYGVFPVTRDYWVLDRADDYSWFISADPTFDRLFIYTRELPSNAERTRLVERARGLGYDVTRLEFPAQPES